MFKIYHISKKRSSYILISFIVLALINVALLFSYHKLYGAADLPFHFKRLIEVSMMLKNHEFLPTYAFNQFNGSAIMFLYPYISIIPLALLSFIFKSKITLLYVYFMFNVFISLCICFFSSLFLSKSIKKSYLFAVVYSVSNIFLTYSFISMDFGIELSYVFFPLIFFGFIELINNNNYLELTFGIILLIFTHVLNTFIALLFIFILLCVNYKRINRVIIKNLLKSLIMVICITSIEWLPTFKFLFYNYSNFHITKTPYLFGYSVVKFLEDSTIYLDTYGIGIFPLIALVLSGVFYKKLNDLERKMFWISILIIIMGLNIFPWILLPTKIYNILKIFQFTYRFLMIPILFLSYLCSTIILRTIHIKYIFGLSIFLILITQIMGQCDIIHKINERPVVSNLHLDKYPNGTNYKITKSSQFNKIIRWNFVENHDYYPKRSIKLLKSIDNNRMKFYYIDNRILSFYNKKNIKRELLPLLLYNKENIRLTMDNKKISNYKNSEGLLSLNNVKRGHHIIKIKVNHSQNKIIYMIFILGILLLAMESLKDVNLRRYNN